jgi:1-acyl-sn-glycerol-3-phosphate acyltransferase
MLKQRLHTYYSAIVYVLTFLLIFPAFFILAQKKNWHKHAYKITSLWGRAFHWMIGVKIIIEDENNKPKSKPCIYVANHFSYADIATMPIIADDACFVGKHSIKKVPLFGYYFTSLHITVNRENVRDRAKVIEKNIKAIEMGKSLIIFPEGGIRTKNPPYLERFKDGAFRTAIAKEVPIVPVSLTNNWRLLPDDGKFLLRDRKIRIVIHKAIDTSGLKEEDIAMLRDKSFAIIQEELLASNKQYVKENQDVSG